LSGTGYRRYRKFRVKRVLLEMYISVMSGFILGERKKLPDLCP
jgi:hypothetical protein